MKIELKNGKKVDAFIEVITEQYNGVVMCSTIKKPTKKDIEYFKNHLCNHGKQKEQLIYDEHGFMYDLRYCVVCGCSLGTV